MSKLVAKITLEQFKEAVEVYRDSDHVNPQAGATSYEYCLYFSDTPSPSGSHRCLIGQILFDLGVTEQVDSNCSIGTILRPTPRAAIFDTEFAAIRAAFDPTDLPAISTLASALQNAADNDSGKPRRWGQVVTMVMEGLL